MTERDEHLSESSIERVVMHRVRRVRALRFVFSGFTASCLLLLLALYGIGREVWVAKVFANGPQDLFGRALYLAYAFTQTQLLVQVLTLVTAISLVYLARELARSITALASPRAA